MLSREIAKNWTSRGWLAPPARYGWLQIRHAPSGIEKLLLGLPGFRLPVLLAPRIATPPTVMLAAAERATEVSTSPIPGVGQEENPAMFASRQASPKVGFRPKNRPEKDVIRQYKLPNPLIVIPSLTESKSLPDFYYKFARLWLIILICFSISSSYSIEANASMGEAGIFFLLGSFVGRNWQEQADAPIVPTQSTGYPEKKETLTDFLRSYRTSVYRQLQHPRMHPFLLSK